MQTELVSEPLQVGDPFTAFMFPLTRTWKSIRTNSKDGPEKAEQPWIGQFSMYEAAEGARTRCVLTLATCLLRVDVQPVSTTVFQKEEEVQAQSLHMLHL